MPIASRGEPGVALDVVVDEALTQRVVAERDFVCTEVLKNDVDEHGAHGGEIRACRAEGRQLQPLGEGECCEASPETSDSARRHTQQSPGAS